MSDKVTRASSPSDDFDELHRWTGISRELFDDVMAWNEAVTSTPGVTSNEVVHELFTRQQELLRRLAAEVRPGIVVTAPRDAPAMQVALSRLRYDERARRLVVDGTADGPAHVLPPVPTGLAVRVRGWVEERTSYATATPENNEAIFAWEDEGAALARELQQLLGDDYELVAR